MIIRTKTFQRREWVCRICGARQGGNPTEERTVCSCSDEAYDFTAARFLAGEAAQAAGGGE